MTPSKRFFLPVAVGFAALLAGCDAPAPSGPAVPQVESAYFAERPDALIKAAQLACSGPGETVHAPRPGVVQCHMLLEPQSTAAAILAYDGTVDDLPRLVVSLASARAGDGYVVTGCAFLKVPQKAGGVKRVVHNDPRIATRLRRMLEYLGGQPLREVPEGAREACLST